MHDPRDRRGPEPAPLTATGIAHREYPHPPLDTSPLFFLAEQLLRQTGDIVGPITRAVAEITDQRAILLIESPRPTRRRRVLSTGFLVPVHCATHHYGYLRVLPAIWCDTLLALSTADARHLAQACGIVLHLLDCTAVLDRLARHLPPTPSRPLTPREQQVLEHMAQGDDAEIIAASLYISRKTVAKHMEHIYDKLRVHSFTEAVLLAYRAGIITCLTTPM